MRTTVKSVIMIVENETIMDKQGTYMRVFNMAYVGTCESDCMPFSYRPGLHRVYRILGI